jgi:hypothetical protein
MVKREVERRRPCWVVVALFLFASTAVGGVSKDGHSPPRAVPPSLRPAGQGSSVLGSSFLPFTVAPGWNGAAARALASVPHGKIGGQAYHANSQPQRKLLSTEGESVQVHLEPGGIRSDAEVAAETAHTHIERPAVALLDVNDLQ